MKITRLLQPKQEQKLAMESVSTDISETIIERNGEEMKTEEGDFDFEER